MIRKQAAVTEFTCPECGYTARVRAGSVRMMYCVRCPDDVEMTRIDPKPGDARAPDQQAAAPEGRASS